VRFLRFVVRGGFVLLLIVVPATCAANPRGEVHGIAVSPDGKTMAVAYMKGNTGFIYKIDMETGIASRLTNAKTGKESFIGGAACCWSRFCAAVIPTRKTRSATTTSLIEYLMGSSFHC